MQYLVDKCAIVLLAAGTSRRLGCPKQLLEYKGRNLLQHSAAIALQTSIRPVIIVTGAGSDTMKTQLDGMNVEIVENKEWKDGIASSLRCGLNALQKLNPAADGVIFMVCDQPHVTSTLLHSLLSMQHETGLPVIASNYENGRGTPALFHKSFFDKLMELQGDAGARKLMSQHEKLVGTVPFPNGNIDIDTRTDYESLLASL